MACNDKRKFKTAEASTKASLRTKGIINKFLDILDLSEFRRLNKQWSDDAKERFNIDGQLFTESNNNSKAVANKEAFKTIDNAKGVFYQTEEPETVSSKASAKTIATVKDFLKRIGVNIETTKDIVVNGVRMDANAVANVTKALIQVIEGKESQALPEEAMHFAVEILEQTNPKLFNKLLKEINDYRILKQIMADYSKDKNYQTADGKPDIRKLKKEAIAKVLAETIISQSEGMTEKPELLAKAENWWSEILNYLKGLFTTSGFDQAALDILSGKEIGTAEDIRSQEGSVFLQQAAVSKQQQVIDKIKSVASTVVKDAEGYTVNGKRTRRVSNIVQDWYERRFKANDLTKSDFQKVVDDLKAEKGTAGHADLEHAQEVFVDSEGNLRDIPLNDDRYVSQLDPQNREMYELLKSNLQERLNSFPKGTKFMSEATIYDAKRNIAGTVDFLAITPEGKVSILDWKFMDLNVDKYEDIPWYKVNAWNTQMQQYKLIIASVYGVKNQDFEQTRMIPIKAFYSESNAKTGVKPKLLNIKIGDVSVKNITEDYLIPVGLEGEKTGNKKIDSLIEKLNAIYKRLSDTKVSPTEKINKAEQLNALFYAIRQLQMKQNITPLINQAKILNKQIQSVVDKYNDKFKGQDPKSFTANEISDFAEILETSRESLNTYVNLDTELRFLFSDDSSEEIKALREDLRNTVDNAREYADLLKDADEEFTNDIIAGSENVKNLSTPEKIVKGLTKWFGNTATIQLKGLETLFKKANKAFAFAGMDTLTEAKKLEALKNNYQAWARSKGLGIRNQFDLIKKTNKNELIDEFNSEFYSTLKSKIQDKDTAWIRDNVDAVAYKDFLDKKKQEEFDRIDAKDRIGTDAGIRAEIAREKMKATDMYSISTLDSVGWLLYDDINKFPKRNLWESKEWQELHRPENKPALDFYNYIKERNDYYREIGYINAKQARTFLPWVRKGLSEKLIFGGNMTLGEQFLRSVTIGEEDTGYGQIDPLTGKPIDTIPIYFTKEIQGEGEASTDLFKTMAMYNEFAIKFKYLSDIEAQGRALIRLEKNKKAIATSYFGKTEYKDDVIQYNPDNNENAKIIEDMVKAIVYQQRYIQSDSFDQVFGKIGGVAKKVNDKLGMKILPESLEGRQFSINKVITQMNNTFQLNALGLNVLSATSNLFGGKTQSLINSGKYFTKTDYVTTEMWLLANKMNGSDKVKNLLALDYFLPFTENYNKDVAKNLSLNKLNDQAIQDFLMILMRSGEKAVQVTNFFAFLKNSIVQDGKVINTREYLKSTPEYADFYAGAQSERDAREARFEAEVKRLNETQGVLALGKIENNEFVIPGVERKSDSVIELRRKVQQFTSDALGSLTEENKRLVNLNVYGSSFMVFKNWIPRLVDVRMGNLKYNAASDAYEWGRSRMVFRMISEDLLGSINNLYNTVSGNDKGIEYIRDLFERKKADYLKDTNKELEMTESEFIDLVRQNTKNQLLDTLFYATLFALSAALKALAPDDDEDPIVKNRWKLILKATDKFKDEIGYFYDPTSFADLISKGIFPSMGLLDNYKKALQNFLIESYAMGVGDEELEKKNYVVKYWLKSFPIANQGAALLPMFSPNLAKDLGIKMQSTSGIR